MKIRKLAAYIEPIEAHIVKAMLEDNGIYCFVKDEYMVNMNWLYSNAVGGVKVMVGDDDYEKAMELISDNDKGNSALDNSKIENSEIENNSNQELDPDFNCPECGSDNIIRKKLSTLGGILSLLMFAVVPLKSDEYICLNCGHKWNSE